MNGEPQGSWAVAWNPTVDKLLSRYVADHPGCGWTVLSMPGGGVTQA